MVKLTYADLLQQRRRDLFIGRGEQRRAFRQNFGCEVPEHVIFAIYGQAGTGKSFLTVRFQAIAKENGALAALTNEAERTAIQEQSILQAMARLAEQFAEAGASLKAFDERYKKYRECMQQVEADPDAPQGVFDLVGRTAVRLAIGGAKMTPAGQAVGGFLKDVGIEEEGLVEQAGAWADYVARKFKNKDEVSLVREPVETLTPLFVDGLNQLAEEQPVVLCFDTWEQTGEHLDKWLRGLLERRGLSANVWLVIAGRHRPGDKWEPFYPLMASFELTEFTQEETLEYLKQQGITEEERVKQILAFSGGVPVLVSTLASAKGGSAEEAASDLVERYLKWVDDARRREAALNCAAARRLNKDVVAAVMGGDDAGELFDWLISTPFVQSRPGYWEYHPKVRRLMLRYVRARSVKDSNALHGSLQAYYRSFLPEKEKETHYRDEAWRRNKLESLYHGLMQESSDAMHEGVELFLLALRSYYSLSGEVVMTWAQAADEQGTDSKVAKWAERLVTGWLAVMTDSYHKALPLCTALQQRDDLSDRACAEVYRIRGLAFYELLEHERAIADYSRAIELGLKDATMYQDRGAAYYESQEYKYAIADYTRVIELNPEDASAYRNRGVAYADLQDYDQAVADYTRAIELNPRSPWTYGFRAIVYRANEDYESAIADLSQAIELDPDLALAYHDRGDIYYALQDYDQAVADYSRAIELDSEKGMTYMDRGCAYAKLQDYGPAITDYSRAIELNPESASAYNARGEIYLWAKDFRQAIADYSRAIGFDPEDATAYGARGVACYFVQDYEQAIADCSRAIELAPENAMTYWLRGLSYSALQDHEHAIADYDHVIELDPQSASAYVGRGLAYAELQDYDRAITDYTRAIEIAPEDAAAYYNKACAYAQMENVGEAARWLEKAISLDEECRQEAYEEADFDGMRDDERFQSLIGEPE